MDNQLVFYCEVSVCYISDDAKCIEILESALLLDVLLEIASLAKLSHDIDVVLGHEYLDSAEYMRVSEGS
jgi:hypothetical protein